MHKENTMLIQASELVAKPGKGGVLGTTVTKMRDVLSETSGSEWTAWVAAAGRPYGTFGLTGRRDDYAGQHAASTTTIPRDGDARPKPVPVRMTRGSGAVEASGTPRQRTRRPARVRACRTAR
jgi:hypothetical protein